MPNFSTMIDANDYTQPSYGPPAEWGKRVVAFLIDIVPMIAIYIVGFIVSLILGAIADALGLLMLLVTYAAAFAFAVYNVIIAQGKSGQTIGKKNQGIRLVSQATNMPIGVGNSVVRYIVGGIIGGCCFLDYFWPLWDKDKLRLTDKVLKNKVVMAG
jgi:uncharacterized RDD family membrane protein YckC